MRLRPIAAVLAVLSAPLFAAPVEIAAVEHPVVATVERYIVDLPEREAIPYAGPFRAAFPRGLPAAYGSGLRFKGYEADASLSFWALTDRGPNGDSPRYAAGGKTLSSKVFLAPDFTPRIGVINVQLADSARLASSLPLRQDGKPISGRPLPLESSGSSQEMPLSDALKPLKFDDFGLDPEGIDVDRQGRLWIVDEYGPVLAQVDAQTGEILQQYLPGAGLPAILAERQPNRGFEGVAVTPAGKVVAAVQSTLDVKRETRAGARFIRLVELDPASGATRMFAYPLDVDDYKRAGDAKLGDIVAIDETRFLLIEQGKDKNKRMRNIVYLVDLAGAQDLSGLTLPDGRALEYGDAQALAALQAGGTVAGSSNIVSAGAPSGLRMARKTRLFDLRELGWTPEKAEGLAIVAEPGKGADATQLAFVNDNDFGLKGRVGKDGDPEDYAIDAEGKLQDGKGKPVDAAYAIEAGEERDTQLWMVHLKRPLKDFFPK